jgi:hypothetical protein
MVHNKTHDLSRSPGARIVFSVLPVKVIGVWDTKYDVFGNLQN